MAKHHQNQSLYRLAGYAALIEQYDLDVIPNWHTSMVTIRGTHRIDSLGGIIKEVYPSPVSYTHLTLPTKRIV